MPYLNDVKLMGFVTRPIELRHLQSGTAVCDVGLALTRRTKDQSGETREHTTFVEVTLWARQAEIAAEYVKKGDPLFVQGRLELDTWQDRQTGENRSRLKVSGEAIQLLTKPQKAAQNGAAAKGNRPAPAPRPQHQEPQGPALPDEEEPSDIPF